MQTQTVIWVILDVWSSSFSILQKYLATFFFFINIDQTQRKKKKKEWMNLHILKQCQTSLQLIKAQISPVSDC